MVTSASQHIFISVVGWSLNTSLMQSALAANAGGLSTDWCDALEGWGREEEGGGSGRGQVSVNSVFLTGEEGSFPFETRVMGRLVGVEMEVEACEAVGGWLTLPGVARGWG